MFEVETSHPLDEAIEAGTPGNPRHLDTLAAVEAERGRFTEAVRAQEAALRSMPVGMRPAAQQRLELYRAGRAYRSNSGWER